MPAGLSYHRENKYKPMRGRFVPDKIPKRYKVIQLGSNQVRRPSPLTSGLSTQYTGDICLVLVGLVACGERWPIFERYTFVTSITGAVHHDSHQDNNAFMQESMEN